MLPIIDRPLIQYAAEKAIEAGADTLIFLLDGANGPSLTILINSQR
jgi:UTP-glucose-1-phosphate uridylyltransferase